MTIIASVLSEGTYVMFADTLISGNEKENVAKFPNINDLENVFPKGSGFVPIGLRQKICIIYDNLVVAWSGNEIFSLTAIKELKKKFSENTSFTEDIIGNFFDQLDYQIKENCSFCLLVSRDNYYFCYRWMCREVIGSSLGSIFVGGSGADYFLRFIKDSEESFSMAKDDGQDISDLSKAVSNVLNLCSGLNYIEILGGDNLLRYFGGAYEIVYPIKEKFGKIRFEKLKEVTYITWVVDIGEQSITVAPTGIITKNFYIKDILFVRRLRIMINLDGSISGIKDKLFAVMPVLNVQIINGERFKIPPIHSEFTCTSFFQMNEGKAERVLNNLISYTKNSSPNITLLKNAGKKGIEYSQDYTEKLLEHVSKLSHSKEIKFGTAKIFV